MLSTRAYQSLFLNGRAEELQAVRRDETQDVNRAPRFSIKRRGRTVAADAARQNRTATLATWIFSPTSLHTNTVPDSMEISHTALLTLRPNCLQVRPLEPSRAHSWFPTLSPLQGRCALLAIVTSFGSVVDIPEAASVLILHRNMQFRSLAPAASTQKGANDPGSLMTWTTDVFDHGSLPNQVKSCFGSKRYATQVRHGEGVFHVPVPAHVLHEPHLPTCRVSPAQYCRSNSLTTASLERAKHWCSMLPFT